MSEVTTKRHVPGERGKKLLDFGRHWKLDGDVFECRACNRVQHVSYSSWDFPHAGYCDGVDENIKPWETLSSILNVKKVKPDAT